jgi:asparagine synthase (glutamine-hydrolysing)
MCGICGQYNFGNNERVSREDLERMARSIAHRGPDDDGFYVSGSLGLGFRRLSIIDLSGGHQPMSDSEERIWVVFNGEIYNFPELRSELESFGHKFRTNSDTEVIIHGYKQWGRDVLNHLSGMFGLAIWDEQQRRLVLARDRYGIKSLYYCVDSDRLYFGSEIRAILAVRKQNEAVDPRSLYLFLRYRFTPSPGTIFKNINKLAPGTMLLCENGRVEIRRWYQYKPKPFERSKSIVQVQDELLDLYTKSMRRHLLSDVPVGLLLSGGIDSGMLLALMNQFGDSWRTFTVGYGNDFVDDELRDARTTAGHFSSLHTAIEVDRREFEEALPSVVASLEEPVASSSIVAMHFVCKRARQDVKVALIGQGPDELFGGYRRHLGVRYGPLWRVVPAWARRPLRTAAGILPRNETLKRAASSLDVGTEMERFGEVLSLLPGKKVKELFRDGLLNLSAEDEIAAEWRELEPLMEDVDELSKFQFIELRSTLADELLMYADKISMAHSLEVRVPYLDQDLVEYVERLPARFKVHFGRGKWIHRRVCQQFLPADFMARKKRGFAVNVTDDWFRSSLDSKMEESLLDSSALLYQFLRYSTVREMLREHKAGRHDLHKVLFSLTLFEQWLRNHSVAS